MDEVVAARPRPDRLHRLRVERAPPGGRSGLAPGRRRGEGRHRDAPGRSRPRARRARSSSRWSRRPELSYAGLWTHLAVADEPDDPFTAEQLGALRRLPRDPGRAGVPSPWAVHAANSAGAIAHPSARYDVVRCGILLYGYRPSGRCASGARGRRRRAATSAPHSAGGPMSATCASSRPGERHELRARLRPAGTGGCGHGAGRLRGRGPTGLVRSRRRGADRRPAPSCGRRGDDGPAPRRLRARTQA